MTRTARLIRAILSLPSANELRLPTYRSRPCLLAGHCYTASEAYYHAGGRDEGWYPAYVKHEGTNHWFLARGNEVLDLTVEQFSSAPPYDQGRRCGFLTRQPSKRTQIVLDKLDRFLYSF